MPLTPKYQPADKVTIKGSQTVWVIVRIGKTGPLATDPQYAVIGDDQASERRVVRESLITEKVEEVSG